MMPIQFTDAEVAAKFETDYESDPKIHLPGDKVNGVLENGWAGKLSNIPLKHAQRWADRPKQNLIRRKAASNQQPAAKQKKTEDKEQLN